MLSGGSRSEPQSKHRRPRADRMRCERRSIPSIFMADIGMRVRDRLVAEQNSAGGERVYRAWHSSISPCNSSS